MPDIQTNGATIAYTDTGAPPANPAAATILFGHGLLFSGWMFHPQIEALRSRYRCVTVDWRGQGESPPSRDGYDMDTLTGDALALVEHLGVGPVHYVGLSMGGFVGQRLAARHGHLLRSLTLLDSSSDVEDPAKSGRYTLMANLYPVIGIAPLRAQVLPLMFGPTFLASPHSASTIDEFTERLRRCPRGGIRKAVLGVARRAAIHDELGAITVPTMVAVGAQDAATPPPKSERIAAAVPGARLEVIPDAGHSSTLEQPAAVTALLRDFLATTTDSGSATGLSG